MVGKTYQYTFDSKSVTELIGTTDEKSTVGLQGEGLLAVSQNDFVLTLQNFKLVTPSGQVLGPLHN